MAPPSKDASNALAKPGSRLAPCPQRPNCVSTLAPRGSQSIEPISYQGTLRTARQRILGVLRALPRTRIVKEEPAYIHAECRSAIFRFVDDVEIEIDDEAKLIHFRSAARLGYGDFGVNRKRMERFRREFLSAGG